MLITSLLFYPEKEFYEKPEDYHYDYENVAISIENHLQLHGWFLRAQNPIGVLFYLHGNAGNVSGRLYKVEGWVKRGFSVLLLDYRGYGKSQGKIEQGDDIVKDGEAGISWILNAKKFPLTKVVLYGESLGTHPIIRLGMKYKVASVVLEAPYTSFVDLAPIHYGLIPPFMVSKMLQGFEFENLKNISSVQSPIFILHGTQDETCPYEMGEKLFEEAPEPKGFFSIPHGCHNDLPAKAGDDYWQKPYEFVLKYLKK